jgi:ribosomal-protein-serine acetyltransferase
MNLTLERLALRLETTRLQLRAFEPADAPVLFALIEASRAHLDPWLVWHHRLTSLSDVEHWLSRGYDASEAYRMGLFTKADDRLIGAAGLKLRSVDQNSAWYWVDVNYWLAPEGTGRGYATEAARRLARHAFEDLASPRVEIRAEPENVRSLRVAERLGFRCEAVLRAVGHRRGAPIGLAIFALIAEEAGLLAADQKTLPSETP